MENNLREIAKSLVAPRKGILAADESVGTMTKRLASIGMESTLENRSLWREIMVKAEGIENYVSGVILFDETIRQPMTDGKSLVEAFKSKGIHPGIKVDKGTVKFNKNEETFTQGLDKLEDRLKEYKEMGAVFAKWRAVYKVGAGIPSETAVTTNSIELAQYAFLCQRVGLVPIVEPEVLVLQGSHDIEQSRKVTETVLKDVFAWLKKYAIQLDGMLLKPNMVLAGTDSTSQPTAQEISRLTVESLESTVPAEVPGIVFLSGGLTPDQSTEYLSAMNKTYKDAPWQLSYSFGRALQAEGLKAWGGKQENVKTAQEAFLTRAKKVSAARE